MNRTQRRARVASSIGAMLVTGLLAVSGPVAVGDTDEDPDADRPAVWQGTTGVVGVQLAFDPEPFLPVSDIVNVSIPQVTSDWTPTAANARATPAWPGGFVTGFPNLLLPFVIGTEAPPYPVQADAKYPDQTDAELPGGSAVAHAGRDFVEARASYLRADLQQGGIIQAGAIESSTRQDWVDGVLTARAETLVTDIRILGEIFIESVRTVAISRSDAEGPLGTDTDISIGRVTVGGVPAVIDESGLSIAGQDDGGALLGAAGPVARQASEFLAELGQSVQISLIGADETLSPVATARAAGLLITMDFEVTSPTGEPLPGDELVLRLADTVYSLFPDEIPKTVPPGPNVIFRRYFGTITIGNAMARTSAAGNPFSFGDLSGLIDGEALGGLAPSGGLSTQGSTAPLRSVPDPNGPGALSSPAPAAQPSATPNAQQPAAPAGNAPVVPVTAGSPGDFADSFLLSEVSADRLGSLYGVALLAIGALFVGSHLGRRRST